MASPCPSVLFTHHSFTYTWTHTKGSQELLPIFNFMTTVGYAMEIDRTLSLTFYPWTKGNVESTAVFPFLKKKWILEKLPLSPSLVGDGILFYSLEYISHEFTYVTKYLQLLKTAKLYQYPTLHIGKTKPLEKSRSHLESNSVIFAIKSVKE